MGPNIIWAPVFSARSTWPETKSAWKWVMKIYFKVVFSDLIFPRYLSVSLRGSIIAASLLDFIKYVASERQPV